MNAHLAPDRRLPDPASLDALGPAAGSDEEIDLGPSVARLVAEGWSSACLPRAEGGHGLGTSFDPDAILLTSDALRTLGRADLTLARLYEGHVNAVKLVVLHAGPRLRRFVFGRVRDGALLGVWGAPGADPLRVASTGPEGWTLAGGKAYASGLGLVPLAIVTVADPEVPGASRLLLVDVDDPTRQDPHEWRASGMRATRSGGYRFDGVVLPPGRLLGGPGVYEREPWFQGGIWRYAAAHVGAMEAIVDETLAQLSARSRESDPHQGARLGRAAALVVGARALVERAAHEVETANPDDATDSARAAALALLARELVEEHAVALLALVERSLGMAAYERGTRIERLRRDLGLYLRQAAPDAKLALAVMTLAQRERSLSSLW